MSTIRIGKRRVSVMDLRDSFPPLDGEPEIDWWSPSEDDPQPDPSEDLDVECCLKVLPSYGPNEDGDYPDCDCKVCRVEASS